MWNAQLNEAQAGIKVAGRNINNLRCTDDTTLMAEGKEELNNLFMKVKGESESLDECERVKWNRLKIQHSEN